MPAVLITKSTLTQHSAFLRQQWQWLHTLLRLPMEGEPDWDGLDGWL